MRRQRVCQGFSGCCGGKSAPHPWLWSPCQSQYVTCDLCELHSLFFTAAPVVLTPFDCNQARLERERVRERTKECIPGGTTCLTLLVEHMFSSKEASNAAKSISRIRQVVPQRTDEAVLDK